MSAVIKNVIEGSPAKRVDIRAGDTLIEINGNTINDILDYMYYCTDSTLKMMLSSQDGKIKCVIAEKDEYEDLGLEFEQELMDRERSCQNKCIFCFIDQLPAGLRNTLYYKDDDTRLSFLTGNYVTLTNLSDEEIDRIIKLKISPLNISVHTLNPKLRVKMMNNKNAGRINELLKKLADSGINIRCQIVLCRGVNDAGELLYTLNGLKKLYPAVSSISVVPVGITRYREKLHKLLPFDEASARDTVSLVSKFALQCKREFGVGLCYLSDEFYMLAGEKIPSLPFYDELEQLENGVGMTALFCENFKTALMRFETDDKKMKCSVITGVLAEPVIKGLIDELNKKWHNLDCTVYAVKNEFFGEQITVAGLVTGRDIINQLKGKKLGSKVFIPSSMLRYEGDMFLDNITLEELSQTLNTQVCPVYPDGEDFLKAITNDD